MANVFLSYAREDSAKAAIIAKALSGRDWTVWWDRTIPPGKTFDDVIEDALDRAACVVVLWSRTSVLSHWVRAEAAEGARRGILVPALLEAAKIPLEFRRVQAADLTSWHGDPADPEFERFVQSITALIQPAAVAPAGIASPRIAEPSLDLFESSSQRDVTEQQPERRRSHALGWATLGIIAMLVLGVAWWLTSRQAVAPPVSEKPLEHPRTLPPGITLDPRVDVPLIVGLQVDDARTRLDGIGLRVGGVREANENGPAGTITAQRPGAGERVSPGAAVDLVVARSSGAKPAPTSRARSDPKTENRVAQGIEVPALTGLSIEEARDRTSRRGLTVGSVTTRASDRMAANTVLSQEPAAGTRQPSGTPIALVIAEVSAAPADSNRARGARSPATNSITNIRATDRSPSEVTFEADVFYDGASGTDRIYLTATAMNGKTQMRGATAHLSSPLRVGAGHASVTLRMWGTVADATSTDVNLCIRATRPGPRTEPVHCQTFPLAKKWVLPMNTVTNFRSRDAAPSELVVNVSIWYDGTLGTSRILLQACPRGANARGTRVGGIRCGQAPLQVGPNNVELTMTMDSEPQMLDSSTVEVCLVGPRYFECQVFPHQKRWSR